MNMSYTKYPQALIIGLALLISGTPALAGEVTIPNTFTSGTPALAAEVNGNFTAVKTAVDDNAAEIAALKTAIAALQDSLAAANDLINDLSSDLNVINSSEVMALEEYLTVTSLGGIPNVTFSGINVQVVNGLHSTASVNGTGNLIVGYNEADNSGTARCTVGGIVGDVNVTTCEGAGGIWTTEGFKTGSHYIVAGSQNNYSSYGGVVFGRQNTSNHRYAGVSGGEFNTASGTASNVSGGHGNTASGWRSNVSGGGNNTASGYASNVSGGVRNTASGQQSNVSGGNINTASGSVSNVSGGAYNTASGDTSNVSGGGHNTASGQQSNVSGGDYNTAGAYASNVSGGNSNTAGSIRSSILGAWQQETATEYQTIPALP